MNDTQFYTLFFLLVAIALLSSCGQLRPPNPIDTVIEADVVAEIRAQRAEQ